MDRPNPSDYSVLFQGLFKPSGFMNEVFMDTSLGRGNILLIQTEDTWNTFMAKETEQECLKIGLELFSNKEKYAQYSQALRHIITQGRKLIKKYKTVPTEISQKELRNVFNFLGKFWHEYGFTEFPYHNLAYQELERTGNPTLKQNLHDFAKLKFEGREFMNAVIFSGGIAPTIIASLSQKFFQDNYSAYYLFIDELEQLFEGKKVSPNIIKERKIGHTLLSKNGKIVSIFTGRDHLQIARIFLAVEKTDYLQGVCVHQGKIQGRAVIAPMVMDMNEMHRIENMMKKGNILVAQTTSPELMSLCRKAAAIVTDQGGMLSHAAIISRELKIPCIVGTINATKIFKDGDLIEVDANQGIVRKL